jgi:archaellum component FlaD/FlaE
MKEKKVIDLGDLDEESLQGDIPFLKDDSLNKGDDGGEEGEFPPFEFPGEENDDKPPFMMETGAETPQSVPSPEVHDKINTLEEKLDQLDSTLETVRKLDEETEEKINRIEKSLEEMLHLYELVTNEMNPFVDTAKKDDNGGDNIDVNVKLPAPTAVEKPKQIETPETCLHLTQINNEPGNLMLVLKWLEFLLKKAGYVGMIKALLYYEELGWISETVRSKLIKIAEDIKAGGGYGKKSLTIRDHMVSLFFISKLQGLKVSPMIYASIVEELQELGLRD